MKNNISLRSLYKKDAPLLLECLSNTTIASYFHLDSNHINLDSMYNFIQDSQVTPLYSRFAITDIETDEYLGIVSLENINLSNKSAEYVISLRKEAQAFGYGYVATMKILEYSFNTLDLQRVYFNVLSKNETAINFFERCGFVYEGEFSEHIFIQNEFQSLKWFRLMKHEYDKIMMSGTSSVYDVKLIEFAHLGDDRGQLVVVEGRHNIPFDIKRIFYIYGSDSKVVRGQHANRHSAFCMINVRGTSKIRAIDCNGNEKVFNLDRPNIGLYLPKMIWKDMYDFSSDSVLLVLSSEYYDGSEYIRSYDDFLLL